MSLLIPEDIRATLDEIAERLWSGHASVMVGAGFSKNGIQNASNCKPFLNWAELANIFHKKLHNRLPSEKDHYLDPLKLADELQAAFGRPSLEKLIQNELPDLDYSPSDLHRDLLDLPWNDVFTTNYDTLLERTKVSQKYDVVLCKGDLVFSQRPRIIKLHGSFPSHRPFIITEEDYRKYPKDYALLVNTVQQSLIENTLCLIGFSGDDPNFLNWIGWIRDNLGPSSSPRIFLVGALDLSSSQIKLLEQRNIAVLNLSDCIPDKGGKHSKALQLFLDYLKKKKAEENRLDWPEEDSSALSQSHDATDEKCITEVKLVTVAWGATRETYPGWVVCPNDRRQVLWRATSNWTLGKHLTVKLPFSVDIAFWDEFVWRLDRCLCPIFGHLIPKIEEVVARYSPFPNLTDQPSEFRKGDEPQNADNWSGIGKRWLALILSLIRFYREEGLPEKWHTYFKLLTLCRDELSAEQRDALQYEQCLFYMFQQDIAKCRETVKAWKPDDSAPFYQAKKAGLLAEFGEVIEAKTILENALQLVRSQLNLVPITTDYTHISQEAYILQLLKFVKDAESGFSRPDDEDRRYIEEYSQRWTKLKQYKCDPWGELKLFEAKLSSPAIPPKTDETVYGFDIGESSTSLHFGRTDMDALEGFAFLRHIEDIGIPFHIQNTTFGKDSAIGAIKRISRYSPHWATAVLLRTGDEKSVNVLFDRLSMQAMATDKIEALTEVLLALLAGLSADVEKVDGWKKSNIGIHYAGIVPELLSHLCTRCSFDKLRKILDFLVQLYRSPHKAKYSNIRDLVKRLVASWPPGHLHELIFIVFTQFPITDPTRPLEDREFPDPLDFVDRDDALKVAANIHLPPKVIDDLIEEFDRKPIDKRQAQFSKLAHGFDYGLMSETQKLRFSQSLWKELGKDGFPKGLDNIFRWCFVGLPHPEVADVENTYHAYLSALQFPAIGNVKSFPITGGQCPACSEIIGGARFLNQVKWTSDDASSLFRKLLIWWQTDSHFLKELGDHDSFNERRKELRSKFSKAARALASGVIPFLSGELFQQDGEKLKALTREMGELTVPVAELKGAYLIRTGVADEYIADIVSDVLSNDEILAITGVFALTTLLDPKRNANIAKFDQEALLSPLVGAIKWRSAMILPWALANYRVASEYTTSAWKAGINDVLFGLERLLEESSLSNQNSLIPTSDRLHVRQYAASLAFRLYLYFQEQGLQIPPGIEGWKRVCTDLNEFAEIRNQWLDS